MKKSKIIVLGLLLFSLTYVGLFIRRKVFESRGCPLRQNLIVIWNNSDKDIGVQLRFKYLKPQFVEIARGARACIPVISDQKFESWDALRYLSVHYGSRRFQFVKSECLNACPGKDDSSSTTRYFMIANLGENDHVWEQVKKSLVETGKELDENYKYLIFSNYGKLGSCWSEGACLQAKKVKRVGA